MTPLQETSSPRAEPRPQAIATPTVVLAGPDALPLRAPLEKQFAPTPVSFATADTILEAVLISGNAEDAPEDHTATPLVIAGVTQELEQLEAAVHSLRKVYPASRIILVCEPEDEVLCRKALNWGATDYLILPADPRSLQRLCTLAPPTPRPATPNRLATVENPLPAPADLVRHAVLLPAHPSTQHPAQHPEHAQPTIPLLAQTSLLSDLLHGKPDFHDRLLATLQNHLQWTGNLRYLPADADAYAQPLTPHTLHHPVALPGHAPLGTLILEPKNPASPAPFPAGVDAALAHAATWMATLLSISLRYEQLRSLAITDELSGASNRRYFNRYMQKRLEDARADRSRVTLLLYDIDDFKKYNDTFGHASGDAIIRELIKLLRRCTRPADLVARLGGDEFAVVFADDEAPRQPNSEHPKDVLSATERFRKAIKDHPWPEICKIKGELSISGGLATFPWDADTLDTLMARADEALLRAKAAGKNAILLHRPTAAPCEEK
ncbi:MAG: GGDEF domain-containing protein [Phycisphaerae bacterium]